MLYPPAKPHVGLARCLSTFLSATFYIIADFETILAGVLILAGEKTAMAGRYAVYTE